MRNLMLGFALCLAWNAHATGGMVGSGGDALLCSSSAENSYAGLYALDYLMTMDQKGDGSLTQPDNWQQSLDSIQQMLQTGYPALADSLANFRRYLNNTSDWTQARIWLDAPQGLLNLNDQEMTRKIPANCGKDANGGIDVIQTVVREKKTSIIQYEVDYGIFQQLQSNAQQFSFLLIHEWLWDLTSSPETIRLANHFLHSKLAAKLSPADFKLSLNNIGIAARSSDFVSFCDRSPAIQNYYGRLLGKTCDKITPEDFKSGLDVRSLDLSYLGVQELWVNDFSGLDFLQQIKLSGNLLSSLPSEIFDGLPALESLYLDNNKLSSLDLELFNKLSALSFLNLENNNLTELPERLFKGIYQTVPAGHNLAILLDSNHLTSLPPGLLCEFTAHGSFDSVGLQKNMFSADEQARITAEAAKCNPGLTVQF